ncbi:MAG: hypothetical protein L6Q57_05435 [Alphaproteobacteria bacterium]|nr:hypothetical protein [Alphaproteobacteria bacterium]
MILTKKFSEMLQNAEDKTGVPKRTLIMGALYVSLLIAGLANKALEYASDEKSPPASTTAFGIYP